MRDTITITVEKIADDYIAFFCINGVPQRGIWGSGRNSYEAIGDLVSHNEGIVGIRINFP